MAPALYHPFVPEHFAGRARSRFDRCSPLWCVWVDRLTRTGTVFRTGTRL